MSLALDEQVRQLWEVWRKRCQNELKIRRNEKAVLDVFHKEETSCAQWIVVINNEMMVNAFAEFLQIFQLAIAAGPRVLNDIVWGYPCPLASCSCCDRLDLQITITFYDRVGMIFKRKFKSHSFFNALFEWKSTTASDVFKELQVALLRYPQHSMVPPILIDFQVDGLESETWSRNYVGSCSIIRYVVYRNWKKNRCSILYHADNVGQATWATNELKKNNNTELTCSMHSLTQLSIILFDGEIMSYVPTRLGKVRMECGEWTEVVVFASPTDNECHRKQQLELVTSLKISIGDNRASVSSDHMVCVNGIPVAMIWKEASCINDLRPLVMTWHWYDPILSFDLRQLFLVVGTLLRQLDIDFAVLRFSQMVMILNQCPLLAELTIRARKLDMEVGPIHNQLVMNSHLRILTIYSNAEYNGTVMIKSLIIHVGQTLTILHIKTFARYMVALDAEMAYIIARACPNLRVLDVEGSPDTFCDALVNAFDQGYLQTLRSLSLVVNELSDRSILIALQDPKRGITKCLDNFSTTPIWFCRSFETEDVIRTMLLQNNSLVNTHFGASKYTRLEHVMVREAKGTIPVRNILALSSIMIGFPIEIYHHIIKYSDRPRYRSGLEFMQERLSFHSLN